MPCLVSFVTKETGRCTAAPVHPATASRQKTRWEKEKQVEIALQIQSEPTIQATSTIMNMLVGNLLRNAIAAISIAAKL